MPKKHPLSITTAAALALALSVHFTDTAHAGATTSTVDKNPVEASEKSIFDKIWAVPTIYKNDESNFFNEFRFVGRAHFDAFTIDSDRGTDADWIVRRLRIGGKARMFHNLDLHVEVDLDPQNDHPAYRRLTDAYLSWKFSDALRLTVGKQSVKFTLDGATSSNSLLTIDRGNVANNLWFPTEYISGISLNGKKGNWQYNTGFFSGGTETKEFGNFDEGHFFLASLGYDFGKALGVKKALLRGDYVYNDRNAESNATRSFEHIGALVFEFDSGRWGFSAEVAGGLGYGTQSDVFGATVMPWFNVTDKLQVVARYNYLASDDASDIRLARYDSTVTGFKGDEYHEIYGGVNYYIYNHKLKVQTGLSHVSMQDSAAGQPEYHSWQWTTGLRISW